MEHRAPATKSKISSGEFGSLGLEDMAYVKTVLIDGKKLHAIHAADGTPLSIVNDRNTAFATVSQHNMQPMSVH